MAFVLQSCHEGTLNPNICLELGDYDSLRNDSFRLDPAAIRMHIRVLLKADRDSAQGDLYARTYYNISTRPFLWTDRMGLDDRADTLLEHLSAVEHMGFRPQRFGIPQIRADLERMRTLTFEGEGNDINRVAARLEYLLTKAFLDYTAGQRFGFTNPRRTLNTFDVKDSDSVHVEYHQLFDIPLQQADKAFFERALQNVHRDSLPRFLAASEPQNPLYSQFERLLLTDSLGPGERQRVLVNMERCRWRQKDEPYQNRKYVLVNIPAFRLYAVDGDSTLSMRVGCGTQKTKTPLLTSHIKRMDVNPVWIIPRSIVEKDVIRHVGDSGYFARNRYFVRNRKTGKNVSIGQITWSMLMNKDYLVIQEGGQGNSLGRIAFRFDNRFSVFLHDTSSPAFFSRDNRGVSHGCVRVQQPFDLAVFLLQDKDERLISHIDYSMHADSLKADTLDRDRLIRSHTLNPEVPLFITYYTLYPDQRGVLQPYPDVYGYDRELYKTLKRYVP